MNKIIKIILGVVVILALGWGVNYFIKKNTVPTVAPESVNVSAEQAQTFAITYEDNAFNPASISIKKGDVIKFTNKHSAAIRVASNPHPFHTSYSKLDSGTLTSGGSYSIKIDDKVGEISYHNHFNPSVGGVIMVSE